MAKFIGSGSTIGVDKLGTGVTYTKIGQISSFDLSSTVGSIETTDLDSARKEYRPGLPDSGELSVTLQLDPENTEHEYVRALVDDPETVGWQISVPTSPATLYTFSGFPTDWGLSAGGPEELIEASLTVKLTGAITKTTAGA